MGQPQNEDGGEGGSEVRGNPRSCLVTRRRLPREALIRFVLDPQGLLVADVGERLPGRGVWVEARREVVDLASERRLFARGLSGTGKEARGKGIAIATSTGETPGEMADRLLNERALGALAMARKAGQLVTGHAKCDAAIRSGEAVLLIHASDSAEDGRRKLASAVAFARHAAEELGEERGRRFSPIGTVICWDRSELDAALGLDNVNHAVALGGGAARNLLRMVDRLVRFRSASSNETGSHEATNRQD